MEKLSEQTAELCIGRTGRQSLRQFRFGAVNFFLKNIRKIVPILELQINEPLRQKHTPDVLSGQNDALAQVAFIKRGAKRQMSFSQVTMALTG